jgi:hypothetical protein
LDSRADLEQLSKQRGSRLDTSLVDRIMACVECPCVPHWDDAHGIEITTAGLTLWQATIAVDPGAPRLGPVTSFDEDTHESQQIAGWPSIPSAEVLRQAIAYATH